ncbi:MAG TPA: hypothetical protein VK823_09980 [Streptosporangiaceae bacterium]|jgi:hypothetical protein|nr:hypothetical protein [Streptosporangiaceae bacterium]
MPPVRPALIAHADWGSDPRKRIVAVASLDSVTAGPRYRVESLAAAPQDLLGDIAARAGTGPALLGFDFVIGLPRAYAAAAGVGRFPEFLDQIGRPPWEEFEQVAGRAREVSLRRPFYPDRPGGTSREHLYAGLGLSAPALRRRCEGRDAEILFWTLGGKQAGKASLHGWRLLRRARAAGGEIALWPFDGQLGELLDGPAALVVAETYPREFYQYIAAPRGRWSKRRQDDRRACSPGLLAWADALGVTWDADVGRRVRAGFSAGPAGEDEFDAVIGVLGLIGVVTGKVGEGVPADDPVITAVEGWILGRGDVQMRPGHSSLP